MSVQIERNSGPRGGYILHAECILPCDIDEVFLFFADAYQLEQLTPPWLRFRVLTPRPIEMHIGQIIDYRLRIRGIPIRWKTVISAWDPNRSFVDEALHSPYRHWHHEHRFETCTGGTRVLDQVHYDVPGGPLLHWLFLRSELRKIFEYRQSVLLANFRSEKEFVPTSA